MVASVGLKRRVLRDDVVEHIVDSILNGYLKPETKLLRQGFHANCRLVRERFGKL